MTDLVIKDFQFHFFIRDNEVYRKFNDGSMVFVIEKESHIAAIGFVLKKMGKQVHLKEVEDARQMANS